MSRTRDIVAHMEERDQRRDEVALRKYELPYSRLSAWSQAEVDRELIQETNPQPPLAVESPHSATLSPAQLHLRITLLEKRIETLEQVVVDLQEENQDLKMEVERQRP